MNTHRLDALSQIVTSQRTRRGVVRTLLGVAAGSRLLPALSERASAGKNRKKGAARCRQLGEQCLRGVVAICQGQPDPEACQAFIAPCCEHFAQGRVGAGVECVIEKD